MYRLKSFAVVLCVGGLMSSCKEMPKILTEEASSNDEYAESAELSQREEIEALKDEKKELEDELRLQRERMDGIASRLEDIENGPEPLPAPSPEPLSEPEPLYEPESSTAIVIEEETYPVVEDGLGMFYRDLAPHGVWFYTDELGYVWQPHETRNPEWQPYVDGYWVWTNEGWTWISNEVFGWAVYHYGRWALLVDYGWIWVPGEVWGPAWVDWRISDDYIGWAPLPPETLDWDVYVTYNDFGLSWNSYCYVETRYFGVPRKYSRISRHRNHLLYRLTRHLNRDRRHRHEWGPGLDWLSKHHGGRKISRYRLDRERRHDWRGDHRHRVENGVIRQYAPLVKVDHDRKSLDGVKRKLDKVRVDRRKDYEENLRDSSKDQFHRGNWDKGERKHRDARREDFVRMRKEQDSRSKGDRGKDSDRDTDRWNRERETRDKNDRERREREVRLQEERREREKADQEKAERERREAEGLRKVREERDRRMREERERAEKKEQEEKRKLEERRRRDERNRARREELDRQKDEAEQRERRAREEEAKKREAEKRLWDAREKANRERAERERADREAREKARKLAEEKRKAQEEREREDKKKKENSRARGLEKQSEQEKQQREDRARFGREREAREAKEKAQREARERAAKEQAERAKRLKEQQERRAREHKEQHQRAERARKEQQRRAEEQAKRQRELEQRAEEAKRESEEKRKRAR